MRESLDNQKSMDHMDVVSMTSPICFPSRVLKPDISWCCTGNADSTFRWKVAAVKCETGFEWLWDVSLSFSLCTECASKEISSSDQNHSCNKAVNMYEFVKQNSFWMEVFSVFSEPGAVVFSTPPVVSSSYEKIPWFCLKYLFKQTWIRVTLSKMTPQIQVSGWIH